MRQDIRKESSQGLEVTTPLLLGQELNERKGSNLSENKAHLFR